MSDKPKVNADAAVRLISQYDERHEPARIPMGKQSRRRVIDPEKLEFWKYTGLGCRGFIELVLFGALESSSPSPPAAT